MVIRSWRWKESIISSKLRRMKRRYKSSEKWDLSLLDRWPFKSRMHSSQTTSISDLRRPLVKRLWTQMHRRTWMVNWNRMIWHSSTRSISSMESSANSGQRTRPQNKPTRTWSICRCRSGWSPTSYRCLTARKLVTQHGGRSRNNRWLTITKSNGGSNSSLSTRES